MNTSPHASLYWQHLQQVCPSINPATLSYIHTALEATNWDEPQSPLDWNNYGVIALVEAEQSTDPDLRGLYMETAIAAFENGADAHPLCAAHLALAHTLIGETEKAVQIAFPALINVLQPAFASQAAAPGLIYVPVLWQEPRSHYFEGSSRLWTDTNAFQQSVLLLGEIVWRSQAIFYNATGRRMLQVAAQVLPDSAAVHLRLGLANLISDQWEGLIHLQRANQLVPNCSPILQALYLAYQTLQQTAAATTWLETAHALHTQHPNALEWQWAKLALDSSTTCVPFEGNLLLVVEPSFHSIVTSVLLGAGDWFEREMEFWRSAIQPGMTVIDVGANVGVYTFSAASQVGASGRVLAIEPFSGCVQCLQETCRLNQFDWVTVCQGAASDYDGTARLSLQTASEMNQIVTAGTESATQTGPFEDVACFSLDSLIKQEKLTQVDFLKIDAEGHELQVLLGSDRLLTEFAPVIMYENISGNQGSNSPVANFLNANGYQLFRYQPYLQTLVAIESVEDLQGNLNIIAVPLAKVATFGLRK
ncbi:FkbM family methyltransferase [Leptolyngbya sp. FACHB-321]|uniref:FkbM family methyltransferase n=1 Tax=Leptolyngbya sp. FACHB-321 TaxID=2692807 RepID=UPI001686314D|nr:FkbM family methyltransferase [Leptolyngbya sp. FACHB-321]MBD2037400.1 FkbM family methyltransferase [Leptolyngbya sp. FACHB-321]